MIEMNEQHPDEQRLWRLANGESDADASTHISTCAECRSEVETLRALATYMATTGGGIASTPASLEADLTGLLRRVRPDLIPARPSISDRVTSALRTLSAALIVDTAMKPQPSGLRGADPRTRQIAFTSDIADLDLEVVRYDEESDITGQLGMDRVPAGLTITFRTPDGAQIDTPVSSDGLFSIRLLPGDWTASIQIDDVILQFPGIRM